MATVISIYELFEILSIIFCIHYLYGEKPQFDKLTVCYFIYAFILVEIIYVLHLDSIWTLLAYPAMFLYCGFKFGFHAKTIFVNSILNIAIIGILQTTIMMLFYAVLKVERPTELYGIFINAITFGIIVIGLRKCKLKKLSDMLSSKEKLMSTSLAVAAISAILFLLTYKQSKGFSIFYYVVLGISIILIAIVVIDIGKNKIKVYEAEAELRQYRLYAASFQNLIDDIRARQHEFDNHINTVYSQHYLYKTYEELVAAQKKYCQEIVSENRYNRLLSKGNPIILCFLYGKFSELEKKGIEIIYKVAIGDLESSVPVHKIVELLGNLLNNAADAVKANGTDRIKLVMLERPETISIEVSNESEEINYKRIQDFFKKGYSEKGGNRGYGLYNVRKICEEYGIDISCDNKSEDDRNWLVFSLLIKKGSVAK